MSRAGWRWAGRPWRGLGSGGRTALVFVAVSLAACQSAPPGAGPQDAAPPPGVADAYQRAVLAARGNQFAGALEAVRQVVDRAPDWLPGHWLHQDVARQLGGAAEQAMRDFYAGFRPRTPLVESLCRARLLPTAYERDRALRAVLAQHPGSAFAHQSLARNLHAEGRFLAAADAYEQALRADPKRFDARRERAEVLVEIGRWDEAAAEFQTYLDAVPEDDPARRALTTLLLYRLGRLDQAKRNLDVLEARLPDDIDLWMDRAAALWLGGEPLRALAKYRAVLERRPDTPRALWNVGLLYFEELGKQPAARARYWPAARAAFTLFLQGPLPQDGFDQFERAVAVPVRLQRIQQVLGPAPAEPPGWRDVWGALEGKDS